MSKQSVDFTCRYEPATGQFQLRLSPDRWSVPVEIERIGRLIQAEAMRRASDGKEGENVLPVWKVLSEALLNSVEVKKIPARGNRTEAAAIRQAELNAILGF